MSLSLITFAKHTGAWLLVFVFWYSIYYHLEPTALITFALTMICVVFSVAVFYTTYLYLVPLYLSRQKKAATIGLFILFLLVTGSLLAYVEFKVYDLLYTPNLKWNYVKLIYNAIIQLFYIAAIAAAIRFFGDKYKAEKALREVEIENAQNELKFLRAQLNPHFMFNSLNTIYFQIPVEAEAARKSLVHFSDLLRYQVYECNVDKISIQKEVKYIESFVELQKRRKNSNYSISFDCKEIISDLYIAPLLIIPFVENAFKYVSHFKTQQNIIEISISSNKNTFQLKVRNTINEFVVSECKQDGVGLNNVYRRLDLIYPGKYQLYTDASNGFYEVELIITP